MRVAFAIVFSVVLVTNASASVMTFTSQAAWEAALAGTPQTETFDGAASDFSANSTGNPIGLLTLDLIGGDGDTGPSGLTGSGFLQSEVDSSSFVTGDGLSLQFNFPNPVSGFALLGLQNDSTSNPGTLDLEEIGVVVAGESFLVSDILGLTDPSTPGIVPTTENTDPIPFIGFATMGPISSFVLVHGDQVREVEGGNEEFYLDGVSFVAVPEPTTLLLLGLGLVGLGFARRRRN